MYSAGPSARPAPATWSHSTTPRVSGYSGKFRRPSILTVEYRPASERLAPATPRRSSIFDFPSSPSPPATILPPASTHNRSKSSKSLFPLFDSSSNAVDCPSSHERDSSGSSADFLAELAHKRTYSHDHEDHLPFLPAQTSPRKRKSRAKPRPLDRPAAPHLVGLDAHCWTCGTLIARINCRGLDCWDQLGEIPRAVVVCNACGPDGEGGGTHDDELLGRPVTEHDRATYLDTISHALDHVHLDNRPVPADHATLLPPVRWASKKPLGAERVVCRLPSDSKWIPFQLKDKFAGDVCTRALGKGQVSPLLSTLYPFTVEVICVNCRDKYRACSDCGGGSPGKSYISTQLGLSGDTLMMKSQIWPLPLCRALPRPRQRKEDVPTLASAHTACGGERLVRSYYYYFACTRSSQEVFTLCSRVLAVRDIPDSDRLLTTTTIRQLYLDSTLAILARPEMLESGDGLARTFQHAESIARDSWNLLEPLAVDDIEQSHGIRRSASENWLRNHR